MENFIRESGVKWLWERIKTLLSAKQDKLVSGTNIKTINGTSLLGSGDVSIEGGGDFNESGTYPNLTAGKATKLATARKIGITGGAVGTGTNFDGSTAINIPVTSLDEGKLTWSKEAILNGTSTFDAIFRDTLGNKLSFLNPDAINIEYSRDNGATWVDYGVSDANKKKLVTPACGIVELYLGKESWITSNVASNQLRITIDAITGNVFFTPRKILVSSATAVSADRSINCVKIEYALYGSPDVWITHFDGSVYGQPGWSSYPGIDNSFGYAAKAYIRYIRLTFYRTGTPQYLMAVTNIAFISNNMGSRYGNNLTAYGHIYSMDVDQNATFPANVTATKHITQGGSANQVVLGDGSLRAISELSPITDADADILLDNHIHSINVNANGNNVNISVIESSKNGNNWETEVNDIPIPLATPTSAGVMSKEDKAKLDGNISIEPDSGMPDFIGDFEYSDVDYEAIIDLTTVDWINWVEGGLFVMNAEETWEEDNGDTSYHQCIITFIYRANGCIPISIVNTNKMTAKMSGMVITINLTEGTGELRFKQIKLI